MTTEEANRILYLVAELWDTSCSCHIDPHCGKCTNFPTDEDVKEANAILGGKGDY